MNLNHQGI